MKKLVLRTLVAATVIVTSGCATILSEDTHKINVSTSNGQKIDVNVDGATQQAPGVITLKKENADKILVTDAEGCTSETQLNKEIEPTFWVNILSGGVFGSSTDMGSKKMWKYQDSVTISCN
ncbi:adenosine deaminase [Paraglaciecola sp.]|uniref:adenosine deaminase n=1 Tax=Pseudomonadati TaxID=3379134 RepID=UPI00273D186A|nr:adenosine deaminase [Paraglaciecola sp.]MDP5033294.1 adenosine deaminase [Paraglaciecola sp.]